jgi:hypothetical protein
MTTRYRNAAAVLGAAAALSVAALPVAQARQGADDPAGHNLGDDSGGLVIKASGADDRPGHDVNDDRKARARKAEARHHHRHRGRRHAEDR